MPTAAEGVEKSQSRRGERTANHSEARRVASQSTFQMEHPSRSGGGAWPLPPACSPKRQGCRKTPPRPDPPQRWPRYYDGNTFKCRKSPKSTAGGVTSSDAKGPAGQASCFRGVREQEHGPQTGRGDKSQAGVGSEGRRPPYKLGRQSDV